jgi:hypothetical protein
MEECETCGHRHSCMDEESPYPTQAQMDAEDREDLYRLIAWMRENREDTRLAGENCVDWAIRIMSV